MIWPTALFFNFCPAVYLGFFTFLEDTWCEEVVKVAAGVFEGENIVVGEEKDYVELDFCWDIGKRRVSR
jgi:hypothetical protein